MQFKKFEKPFRYKKKDQPLKYLMLLFFYVIFPTMILFGNFEQIQKTIAFLQIGVFAVFATLKSIQNT